MPKRKARSSDSNLIMRKPTPKKNQRFQADRGTMQFTND